MSAAADHTADHAAQGASAGAAPSTPLFHERLLPGPGAWIVAVVVGAALGLILVPLNLAAAIIVAAVAIIVLLVVLVQYSPVIEVSDGRFRLSRAQIEVELLGEPVALAGEEWALTIGQDFEPLAHHCVRGWTRTGLRVEVLDPEDPTTAWVASTRRPEDLALALRTAKALQQRGDQDLAD
ncbi:hypothetical protein CFK41_09690 [Brachybacterium ginsengisoli]|uniref:DUF3093 domain-containing protein n=1 Tax=Brachybacterium ginsengisoli TaxID=1331682 RepID=A0A291GXV5_9MICO|nr:DUF3093 domain-containing protein [Brachybacterium ginsengisoli]ATG55008.1 hypothetical protein CFK41_09690 [Brachybacterium ginsengisoli]